MLYQRREHQKQKKAQGAHTIMSACPTYQISSVHDRVKPSCIPSCGTYRGKTVIQKKRHEMFIAVDAMGGITPRSGCSGRSSGFHWDGDWYRSCRGFKGHIWRIERRREFRQNQDSSLRWSNINGWIPLKAVRSKRDSSIMTAFDLLKRKVEAVVSAGNSGQLCRGHPYTRKDWRCWQAGHSVHCSRRKGQCHSYRCWRKCRLQACFICCNSPHGKMPLRHPVSVSTNQGRSSKHGREAGKGNEQVRLTHSLLQESGINFVGNVEGSDILSGMPDSGLWWFHRNIVLKLSEAWLKASVSSLKKN